MQSNTLLKTAVITGGARGIGLAIAQRFHKENYQVVILDCDKETLQILAVDGGFDAAGVGLPSLRT